MILLSNFCGHRIISQTRAYQQTVGDFRVLFHRNKYSEVSEVNMWHNNRSYEL
jgi:hypothetical protein